MTGGHSGQERLGKSRGEMGVGGGLGWVQKDPESPNILQSRPLRTYFLLLATPVLLGPQIMSEPQRWAGGLSSHLQWALQYDRSLLEDPLGF